MSERNVIDKATARLGWEPVGRSRDHLSVTKGGDLLAFIFVDDRLMNIGSWPGWLNDPKAPRVDHGYDIQTALTLLEAK